MNHSNRYSISILLYYTIIIFPNNRKSFHIQINSVMSWQKLVNSNTGNYCHVKNGLILIIHSQKRQSQKAVLQQENQISLHIAVYLRSFYFFFVRRYAGMQIFHFLMSHEDFERSIKKFLSPNLLRNIQDKLDNLKKKVGFAVCRIWYSFYQQLGLALVRQSY